MITFFRDGTFLYGTHAQNSAAVLQVQVEQGFYDFDPTTPANQRLRFTTVTDTNTSATFPTTFAATRNNTSSAGVSATPGPVTYTPAGSPTGTTASTARAMTNVVVGTGTPRTISGTFGSDGTTATAARLSWVLSEPLQIDGQWTGAWVTQDHRRFWVWDYRTNYGMHVGAHGGTANMQDACFTVEDFRAPSGLYTRRGSSTGCYPYNRVFPGQTDYIFNGNEAIDSAVSALNAAGAVTPVTSLPGFIGRIPGGLTAFDGRSPSPLYYYIAPAATFGTTADANIFPPPGSAEVPYTTLPFTTWCSGGEVLGLRQTLNNVPIDSPVYFCRHKAP
jgi:hypothetical protein